MRAVSADVNDFCNVVVTVSHSVMIFTSDNKILLDSLSTYIGDEWQLESINSDNTGSLAYDLEEEMEFHSDIISDVLLAMLRDIQMDIGFTVIRRF